MAAKILLGAALVLASAGCFNSQAVVKERAAREFQCPVEQVKVEELGGNAFRAWACRHRATYACAPQLEICIKEGGSTPAVAGQQPAHQPAVVPSTQMPPALQPTAPAPTGTTTAWPQPTPQPTPTYTAPRPW